MEKVICSDAKQSNDKPIWLLMLDGNIYINQKFVKDATIQRVKLSG